MRILLILGALAGCATRGQLVQPYYQSGTYHYGPISRKEPPGPTTPTTPPPPTP
jgi:hypothetical protein